MKNLNQPMILVILFFSANAMAVVPTSLRVVLETNVGNSAHHRTETFTIEKKDNSILCGTQDTPPHQIKVKGLSFSGSAIKNQKISPKCQTVIHWGKNSACYQKFENVVIDQTIRQCSSI